MHSVLCRYGLPMLPSGGTEPLSTLNPLLFVGLGTTTEGGIKGPTRTRDRTRPRGNGRGSCDHLLAVAVGARSRADKFGAGDGARPLGYCTTSANIAPSSRHDLLATRPRSITRRAGAQVARQRYGIAGHLIAAGVAGHHAGLSNGTGTGERTPLTVRLAASVPDYAAWQCEIALPATLTPPRLTPHPTAGRSRAGLQLAPLSRMIFGALVDAD